MLINNDTINNRLPGIPPAPIGNGRGSSARPSLPLSPDHRLISPLQMRPDRPSQGDNPPITTDNENQQPPTHGPGDAPMDNIGKVETISTLSFSLYSDTILYILIYLHVIFHLVNIASFNPISNLE